MHIPALVSRRVLRTAPVAVAVQGLLVPRLRARLPVHRHRAAPRPRHDLDGQRAPWCTAPSSGSSGTIRRASRSPAAAAAELAAAWTALQDDPDYLSLELAPDGADELRTEAEQLVANYFQLEDPDRITPVGVELTLEARLGDVRLRGILDRLDRTPDGELVVIDYKTGRAPSPAYEQARLAGVQLYALLCQEVLGRRPGTGQAAPPEVSPP